MYEHDIMITATNNVHRTNTLMQEKAAEGWDIYSVVPHAGKLWCFMKRDIVTPPKPKKAKAAKAKVDSSTISDIAGAVNLTEE